MSDVTYPDMRVNIREAIEALADPEHQRRVWVERRYPHPGYYDDLDENVHALFDDSIVMSDPAGAVGWYLYADEVQPFRDLNEVYSPLIDDLGDVDDGRYLADPRWPEVVRRAAVVREVVQRNDERSDPGPIGS